MTANAAWAKEPVKSTRAGWVYVVDADGADGEEAF
jgi:hypothetical protein